MVQSGVCAPLQVRGFPFWGARPRRGCRSEPSPCSWLRSHPELGSASPAAEPSPSPCNNPGPSSRGG